MAEPPGLVVHIVDDDPAVRATVATLLREDGHTVVEACSGAEALSHLEMKDRVDLLMTDLGMPKMNGWELIRSGSEIILHGEWCDHLIDDGKGDFALFTDCEPQR